MLKVIRMAIFAYLMIEDTDSKIFVFEEINDILLYYHINAELLTIIKRFYETCEDNTTMFLLFNIPTILMKYIGKNFANNFIRDLVTLYSKGLLFDNVYAFFNDAEEGE